MSLIDYTIENQIATITMNDHKHRNRFSEHFSALMLKAFIECEQSDARVVIIQAAASDHHESDHKSKDVWSAGHDMHEFPTDKKSDPLVWEEAYRQLTRRIRNSQLPVICSIHSSVWGAGCDLAACCDFIIATPDTTFAITPAKLGIPHNLVGIANFIHAFPDHMLKEIFLLAKPISAQVACRFGFVNRIVESNDLQAETLAFAQDLLAVSPLCISALKAEMRMLNDSHTITSEQAEQIAALRRRAYRSQDYLEGLNAFFQKRPPDFQGK